jgi:multiple sugar transport system permease protein/raffinose/stachyose/melibiose transport system permease protein
MIWVLLPIVWMISTAFKPPQEQFTAPPSLFPVHPTLNNFETIATPWFIRIFSNSLIVASSTAALAIIISILPSYAFARLRFRGKSQLFYLIIISQIFPLAALIIPLYIIFSTLNLLNTYSSLIIAYLAFTIPTAVWLLNGFVRGIPTELEESAQIDGCSRFGAFIRIVLPLLAPGIVATATYVFICAWQEFLFALVLISSDEMKTLTVGILRFLGQYSYAIDWGAIMAACTISSLPVFVLFMLLQRQLVSGLLRGSLKG